MKKNNKLAIVLFAFLVITSAVFGLFFLFRERTKPSQDKSTFPLSSEFYKHGEFRNIDSAEFAKLIEQKKSFVVVARMLTCPSGMPMATNSETVSAEEEITILSLYQDQFKETELARTVKYLPSAAIYEKGKLVAWLDAESDNDLQYYQSPEGFKSWLEQYINLDAPNE